MRHLQTLFLLVMIAWSWSIMTVTHELGHIAGAMVQGARLTRLEMMPWQIPSTLFQNEASRALTLWSGPLIGCLVPVLTALAVKDVRTRFVAAFCVLANGIYLLLGYFSGDAFIDSTLMIAADTPVWILLLVASAMTVVGYVFFRRTCMELLERPKMTGTQIVYHTIAWMLLLVVQTVLSALVM